MTIVLCGGGSGGHITPLLAVARELRSINKSAKLIYIGEKNGKFSHIAADSKLFDELHFVSAGKLRRYHGESAITKLLDFKTNLLNLRDTFKILAGLIQSYLLLKRLKPDAILLKGGFVCVPIALAARAHKVQYITHDSDALPGLSNRIAARWARYHATGMPAQYYAYPQATIRVVGVPTDMRYHAYSEAEQRILREKYDIGPKAQVILVTGGSNGARRLNEAVIKMLPKLIKNHPDIHVLHQIGAGNEDQLARLDEDSKKHAIFFDFSSELFHMSAISDIVIARAGASFIAEFAAQGKACIIVPNPYLTGGHQLKNAKVYADAGAAVIVNEAELQADPDSLYNSAAMLLNNPEKRELLSKNLHSLTPSENAATALAKLLIEISS